MTQKPKVSAEIVERTTIIDNDTGEQEIHIKGKLKGFGKGFADYIAGSVRKVDVTVNTGQYPKGHAKEGRWAVQIMVDDFETQGDANTLADRLAPRLRGLVQSCNAPAPAPMPAAMSKLLKS